MRDDIIKAAECVREADALLIGASNGLSIAEGYNIFAGNEMFMKQFGDMHERYNIRSVLDGCFFPDAEVRRMFLARLVRLWVDEYRPTEVMGNLYALTEGKDYFVITSNADTHLELSGFSAERVFEIEGTFVRELNGSGVDDKSRQAADFIGRNKDRRMVLLELGIGSRNRMIKQPMMQLAAQLSHATYITLNLEHELYVPQTIAHKAIALAGDIAVTLREMRKTLGTDA